MHVRHSIVTAAIVAAGVPVGLLAVDAGASLARGAGDPAATAAGKATVAVRSSGHGKILVSGSNGRSLYLDVADGKNKSNCTGQCASAWPPLLVSGKPRAGAGVAAAKLGSIKRGASRQVTYAGHPLYYWMGDTKPGQTTGEGINGFYLVSASGKAIK
jgi:predicted lipoprotein with Yx(FWY)xxD motif